MGSTPSAEVSGLWGLIGLVIAVIVAPMLFTWLNARTTKRTTGTTLTRIEKHAAKVGNGFTNDVLHKLDALEAKLTEVHDKVDSVVRAQAYQQGRFDQYIEDHKERPPTE
jgi:hypothetical protein